MVEIRRKIRGFFNKFISQGMRWNLTFIFANSAKNDLALKQLIDKLTGRKPGLSVNSPTGLFCYGYGLTGRQQGLPIMKQKSSQALKFSDICCQGE